ncbi:huntingtin-interacting protein 1 isoform X4 [Anabrus simplex]|uniref:huntingtin-interacting protein 1 isoform X4 n=1 Tax=Anabrus simplex TaxID=316456 RepID=UPI0035A32326
MEAVKLLPRMNEKQYYQFAISIGKAVNQIENPVKEKHVHLREGYGKLIQLYCQLLITKLDFHRRNPRFPGNLQVTKEELESIGENDINNYFQMSVEMFDYMDEILTLQSAIFGSLDMSRANSMTSSGQCRLAPLIPCIQDSSQLYDYCVKILFKLHASLPPDTLAGHRDRFLKQFRSLRQFYLSANTLQYFKNLIQIPLLPENPPNFLVQSDLGSYVTPVVILPPEDTSTSESDNVDSSSLVDTSDTGSTGELVDLVHHNGSISPDVLAERDNLIEHLQTELSRLRMEVRRMVAEHNRKVEELKERINELETTLATRESELLQERQLKDDLLLQTEDMSKYQEMEKRTKATEEKFSKLKDIYTKLREEHVQLIRQKADVDKQLDKAKTSYEEAEKSKMEAVSKLTEAVNEKRKVEDSLQQTSSQARAELEALQAAQEAVESEKLSLASKMDWVVNEKSILEGELQDLLSQKEDLDVRLREMEERMQAMETRLHRENLDRLYHLLVTCISQAEAMVKKAVHEVDNPALSAVVCTPDYFQSLPEPVLKSLDDLDSSFAKFISDGTSLQGLVNTVPLMAHLLSTYLIQGKTTSNKSPDIEFGEHIADMCKVVGNESLTLLANLKDTDKANQVPDNVTTVKTRVVEVADMVAKLSGAIKGDSVERIEEMLEDELSAMDKAIEEAAKRIEDMLNKSRQADSGIKLEVNEKILDSCTNLMKAIRLLVQKSRLLQAEIVAQGKGTASAKEFYKRNHQWTEGLISAAKSVGVGAKFLLTAADKVVSGQGKFEQLVVASQEIAASTAQLVVASRVKADRNSSNLLELSKASKGVTQATGQVVATSKSCSQMVDDNEELDVSGLSLHQAKRLEMESQVRVIELEASLQQERLRLSALRRQHYQLAGEVEGWDPVAIKENV